MKIRGAAALPIVAAVVVAVVALVGEGGARAEDGLPLPAALEAALASGRFEGTASGFRMMALSFTADGCTGEAAVHPERAAAAHRCVERAYQRAAALRRQHPSLARSGLWLSHLNLILGAAHRVGPCLDAAEHEAISRTLGSRSLADPTAHAASYADTTLRWPADQSATLASLARFDRGHGGHLADAPVERWRQRVTGHATRADLDLPWSEVTGRARTARQPRGCALAYQTLYVREFDEPLARRWWQAFRQRYLVDRVALVGFREWPPGFDGPSDADSGPIVHGVGAAATAFGLPAARVMGDGVLATRLAATASAVEQAARFDPSLARAASSTLAASIRWLGAHPPR